MAYVLFFIFGLALILGAVVFFVRLSKEEKAANDLNVLMKSKPTKGVGATAGQGKTDYVPAALRRSVGVVFISGCIILTSAFSAAALSWVIFRAGLEGAGGYVTLINVLICAYAVFLGVNLFRLKEWARIQWIVLMLFSSILALGLGTRTYRQLQPQLPILTGRTHVAFTPEEEQQTQAFTQDLRLAVGRMKSPQVRAWLQKVYMLYAQHPIPPSQLAAYLTLLSAALKVFTRLFLIFFFTREKVVKQFVPA